MLVSMFRHSTIPQAFALHGEALRSPWQCTELHFIVLYPTELFFVGVSQLVTWCFNGSVYFIAMYLMEVYRR